MRRLWIWLILLLFISPRLEAEPQVKAIPRAKYLEFARSSADWTWNHYDSLVTDWKNKMNPKSIWGYRPPARLLEMARQGRVCQTSEKGAAQLRRLSKIFS